MRRSPSTSLCLALVFASSSLGTAIAAEPPKDDDWLVDANIGAAKVESDAYRLAADGALGYWTRTWGLAARGTTLAYDQTVGAARVETTKLDGDAEGWLAPGNASWKFRPDLRVSAGGANYSSTYTPAGPGAGPWNDQTSWIWRGTALAGFTWNPNPAFAMHMVGGAGVQVEWYDYISADPSQTALTDDETVTIRGAARLNLRWSVAPDTLTLRAHGDMSYFGFTRDRFSFTTDTMSATNEKLELSQLEVRSRAFVDIDAAEFFGFRPTVHGGIDYFRTSGAEANSSLLVPVAGAGLLRPWL